MDGIRQYLKQRGFDDTTIKEWGLEPNTCEVLINYLGPDGNLLYTRRNRPGKQPKYLSPPSEHMPGGHSALYGLHMLKYITDTLLLIEGEYNCISVWLMGHYGLGVSGQTLSLKDYHLKDIPDTVKKITILYDEPEFAAKRAQEILKYYENDMKVYIAKYPDTKDANDYYIEGRNIDFKAIMNTADPYTQDKLTSPDIKVNIPENDFVEAYKNYAMQISDAPVKYQELMALSIIATVLSRQVYLKYGVYNLYPNLYIVLIGKSTVMRKTACLNIAKHILRKYKPELILPSDFTPEGLFNLLSDRPSGLISWSEFKSFLINANTKSYQAGLKEFITEAYDCPDILEKKLVKQSYEIKNLYLNIITASTLNWLTDSINESDTLGGFLGRFAYMPCKAEDKNGYYYMPQPEPASISDMLVGDLKAISTLNGEFEISDEARTLLIKWLRRHEDELELIDDSKGLIGFYSRLSDYLLKFAMLYEISGYRTLTVSESSMLRAIKMVNGLKKHISELLSDHIAFTKEAKDMQRVLNLIKVEGTITRVNLLNYSHLTARQLNEILDTLVQSERIQELFIGDIGKKKAKAYRLT